MKEDCRGPRPRGPGEVRPPNLKTGQKSHDPDQDRLHGSQRKAGRGRGLGAVAALALTPATTEASL